MTGGRRWTLTWAAVPGADSYEVMIRPTTSAQYEQVHPVTSGTKFELDYQLDDAWAMIRAVGTNGHKSLPTVVPRLAARAAQSGER